jgi:hypothetical protein
VSVLLLGVEDALAKATAERLIAQDDEVRIALETPGQGDAWRARGVHVATGDPTDDDFLWRAFTNVRTVVIGDSDGVGAEVFEVLPGAAKKANVDRLVILAGEPDALVDGATREGIDHVVLRSRKGRIVRRAVEVQDLAAAIDAADDLAGNPRLDLDLWSPAGWEALRLEPPAYVMGVPR